MPKSRFLTPLILVGVLLFAFEVVAVTKSFPVSLGMETLRQRAVLLTTSTRFVALDDSACGPMNAVYRVVKTNRGLALSSVTPTTAMRASGRTVPCVGGFLTAGATSTPKAFYFWNEGVSTSTRYLFTY